MSDEDRPIDFGSQYGADPPQGPPPPTWEYYEPPEQAAARARRESEAALAARQRELSASSGCLPKLPMFLALVIAAAALLTGAFFLIEGGGDGGDDGVSNPAPSADPCPQALGGFGAARATPCTAPSATTVVVTTLPATTAAPTTAVQVTATQVAPSTNASSTTATPAGETTAVPTAPATTAPGGGPPDPASLPPGAVLYHGFSGGEVGCIPCDGAFRFVSVEQPGVVSGGPNSIEEQRLLSAPLPADGVVKSLGVRLSAADGGKWTVNVRCQGPQMPGSCNQPATTPTDTSVVGIGFILACHVPQGATLCTAPADDAGAPVLAGNRLVISVGNPGDPITEGRFTFEWWFVYQPTAPA